VIRHGTICL